MANLSPFQLVLRYRHNDQNRFRAGRPVFDHMVEVLPLGELVAKKLLLRVGGMLGGALQLRPEHAFALRRRHRGPDKLDVDTPAVILDHLCGATSGRRHARYVPTLQQLHHVRDRLRVYGLNVLLPGLPWLRPDQRAPSYPPPRPRTPG